VALLVLALVLAGCGGGSGSGGSGKRGTTTTTKPRTTTTTGAKDTASGPFCERFQALQAQLAQLVQQPANSTTKDRFDLALRGMKELEPLAGDQIKSALATTVSVYEQIAPALAAAGYDASKLPADARAKLDSQEYKDATGRLDAYVTTNCQPATPATPSTTG